MVSWMAAIALLRYFFLTFTSTRSPHFTSSSVQSFRALAVQPFQYLLIGLEWLRKNMGIRARRPDRPDGCMKTSRTSGFSSGAIHRRTAALQDLLRIEFLVH